MSENSPYTRFTSSTPTVFDLRFAAASDAVMIMFIAYRSDACPAMVVSSSSASSLMSTSSSSQRIFRIWRTSFGAYGSVAMISSRSKKSSGIPCGPWYFVPRIVVIPRFVARIRMGAILDSSTRFRKE